MKENFAFPLSDLVLAINRYFLFADEIGEGMAIMIKDSTIIELPMLLHISDPQQVRDFACLRSRLDELPPEFGVELVLRINMDFYQGWGLRFDGTFVNQLITTLCERPGASGWGSSYAAVLRCIRTGVYPNHVFCVDRHPV